VTQPEELVDEWPQPVDVADLPPGSHLFALSITAEAEVIPGEPKQSEED
jgi:hypothetical protein